jgi:NADH-quinone oxidoreductase subunit C
VSAAAELVQALDGRGLTVPAPTDHPLLGEAEGRWVGPEHLVPAAEACKAAGFFFESMTCVDRLEQAGAFELIYTFNRWDAPNRVVLRMRVPEGQAAPTLTGVYRGANWNEREAAEFYGVGFAGHPDLRKLLLADDVDYFPLRKSFTEPAPSIYDRRLPPEGMVR